MYFCIKSSIGTSCKSALTPMPSPVVCSSDRSMAVVLVLFLLFLALCSFVVPSFLSVFFFFFWFCFVLFVLFFCVCVVMLALWSPSSIAAHFAFWFTSCVVMLAFWSPLAAVHFAFCFAGYA